MRATNWTLGAVLAATVLGSTACGGGTVTFTPAGGTTTAATAPTTCIEEDGASLCVGVDGVTASDGQGAAVTVGPDGVTARDGQADSVVVDADAGAAGPVDLTAFCGHAVRYGKANLDGARAVRDEDSAGFAAALTTLTDAVDGMQRSGPPEVQADLAVLAGVGTTIATELERSGGDVTRIEDTIDSASVDGQSAFDRLDEWAVEKCA